MPVDPRIQAALDAPLRGPSNMPKMRAKMGYARAPGSGPQGETCRSCRHSTPHDCSKRYWKCGLVQWIRGAATDIVLKSPACSMWEARNG